MAGGKGKLTAKDNPKPFTSENQPERNGRKPGIRLWKNVFADLLAEDAFIIADNVQELDEDGKPTGNTFRKAKVILPRQEALALSVIKKALQKGDVQAFNAIADRMDGKPTQPLANDPDNPITANINWITSSKEK